MPTEGCFPEVRALLERHGAPFTVLRHEPVYTSEEAARVRGAPLASGAKALVVKAGAGFAMCVIPADARLDGKRARRALGAGRLRFATREELRELTGLEPGAVPPFGSLFGLATACDGGVAGGGQINFNAGAHTISVKMQAADYLTVERPTVAAIARR